MSNHYNPNWTNKAFNEESDIDWQELTPQQRAAEFYRREKLIAETQKEILNGEVKI